MNNDHVYAFRPKDLLRHAVLALTVLTVMLLVQANLPVVHVHLVAPGGPYAAATAAGFALAGGLMLRLALQDVGPERRALFALAGAGAVLVALEPLGFGYGLFGEAARESVGPAGVAGTLPLQPPEITSLHRLASHLIIGWTLLSALLLLGRRRAARHVLSSGVPFFAWWIMPLAALPVLLFSTSLVTHPDELGRLALGLLIVVWAIDLYRQAVPRPARAPVSWFRDRPGLIVAGLAGALALIGVQPRDLAGELNRTAAHRYPTLGMEGQARELFGYILDRPHYVEDDTFPNLRALYPDLANRVVRGTLQTVMPKRREDLPAKRRPSSLARPT